MSLLERSDEQGSRPWRVCLECGNRYQAKHHGYKVNWCSVSCEDRALRRQRQDIETSWIRATWFLR